jgi:hypothetical protein
MSDALDRAILLLAKAQERQDTLAASDGGTDGRELAAACQDRDVFLADVVRLGAEHLANFDDES